MASWEIWDHFQVRSAGFPADWLSRLVRDPGLSFEARLAGERAHLRQVFASPRLQEALVWQNPQVASNFLYPWLDGPDPAPDRSATRRVERKLLSYLQRYCAKNEAIGFFGPIGWGRLRDELDQPQEHDGDWLRERTIYLEPWLFQLLCKAWANREDVPEHRPLRLSPRLRLAGSLLEGEPRTRRRDGRVAPSAAEMAALEAVTRGTPALLDDEPTVRSCLEKRWLSRATAVPALPEPERWAADQAEADSEQLQALEAHKQSLADARDQPRELLARAKNFLHDVAEWTSEKATRFPGQTYSGRLPYYEDCQRRGLDLPSSYLDKVRQPLELVLESARWFSYQAGARLQGHLRRIGEGLLATQGEGCSATPLWDRAHALFTPPEILDLKGLASEVGARWKSLLGPHPEGHDVRQFSYQQLREPVKAAFAAPTAGTPRGRFHSVDLFFTPQAGAVLGEIHPGLFPFHDISTNFQHPQRTMLSDWYSERAQQPEVWPAWHLAFSRLAQDGWACPQGYHLLLEPHWGSWRPGDQQLRLGDFSLFRQGDGLVVRHQNGLEISPIALVQDELLANLNILFKPFDFGQASRPRLRFDGLTVARRRWSWSLEDLALGRDREQRYRSLNQRAELDEMPDELFASFPKEVKPVLWQRRSALSCELFHSLLGGSGEVKLEEMWPERGESWVVNPDGTGTGEFRFVAFDSRGFDQEALG